MTAAGWLATRLPCVPILIVCVAAIVMDLLGGVIFDFDVPTVSRHVYRKLHQMVAEMEHLRG
jgi:hypothetical protein